MRNKLTSIIVLASCLALCAMLVACGSAQPTKEQLVSQKDTWAESVLRAAVDDLAAQGAIGKVPADAKMMAEAFTYEQAKGGYDIAFKDDRAKAELTGDFTLPDGKVVLCDPDANGKMRVFYLDGSAGKNNASVPNGAPLFYPESAHGYFSEPSMAKLLDGVDPSRFASDLDGCDYLIAFDGVYSHVDEDYYVGSVDRKSCTTLAIVVDAKAKKVLHIQNIGTDTPPNQVQAGGENGQVRSEELVSYLNELLVS